jgi:ankyrin repeat protein
VNGPVKNGPLHTAAFKGNMDDVKQIVHDNPLTVNARGEFLRTPLMAACGMGHLEVRRRGRGHW